MKTNPQLIQNVKAKLSEAITAVENYLHAWEGSPKDFTTQAELHLFAAKLREMLESLEGNQIVSIIGLWRIMESWPYENELRKKIVEAEYEYERLR